MVKIFTLVMVRHMLTDKGFTLIETLFVLFVVCILFTISLQLHLPQKKVETTLQEITAFLNEAKLEAMVSKSTVTVSFQRDRVVYSGHDINKSYVLDEKSYFDEYQLTFNSEGHIKKAKTVYYHTGDRTYRFVYQVGSGYFYVE